MTFELALGVWGAVTLLALVAAAWLLVVFLPRVPGHTPKRQPR
ncbi:MAG TPA: hypothetical protein VF902_10270 [Coriobacteriia bacterium]|jgi:hypothetical protein